MTVVGVTGHRDLEDPAAVRAAIDALLSEVDPPLVGVSAIAAGADQIFADAVIAAGGRLEVIVPGDDYESSLPPDDVADYRRLLAEADEVTVLGYPEVGRDAYLAAGLEILKRCDVLIAVWDGEASRGTGGTADIVRRAHDREIPVHLVDGVRAEAPPAE